MDLATLQREHPELYAEVFTAGEKAERKRVVSHLDYAPQCTTPDVALDAIRAGASLESMRDVYFQSALNKLHIDVRQQESDESEAVLNGMARTDGHRSDALGREVDRLMGGSRA